MEILLQENSSVIEVENLFRTHRETVIEIGLSYLFKFSNEAEMLSTLHNTSNKDVCNDNYNRSYLIETIRKGNDLKMIELLIDHRKDCMNRRDWQWSTQLADNETCEIVGRSLLNFRLDYKNSRCLPHYDKHEEVAKLLIEYCDNINCMDECECMPLMTAIKLNRHIILELIKIGANVKARDHDGKTCLHLALYFNFDEDLIDQICSKTDDYNEEDNDGLTPLCFAVDETYDLKRSVYRTYFIHKLINKGFYMNTKVFMHAVEKCSNVELIYSLSKYVDIRCVDQYGNGVLHHARDPRVIELLARKGALINQKNNIGMTPLVLNLMVTHSCGKDTLESLLYWGSDVWELDFFIYHCELSDLLFPREFLYSLILYGMTFSLKREYVSLFLSRAFRYLVEDRDLKDFNNGLLRHLFLSNKNITVPHQLKDDLIKTYNGELDKMKGEFITENLSYYNFCMKQYRSIRSPFGENGFGKDDYTKIKNLFPTFHYDVLLKIRINIKINRRKVLLRYLLNINLCKRREKENNSNEDEDSSCERVKFDCDSMNVLGSYLNDCEIKCFLAAAIID